MVSLHPRILPFPETSCGVKSDSDLDRIVDIETLLI
jgi:hypothetical protein